MKTIFRNKSSKIKIVITGGPCAGKTALMNILALHFCNELRPVEEAATFLFRAGFPRGTDSEQVKCQERAIFAVQRELENLALLNSPVGILCDRGSLDSLAYWPGSARDFFASVKTSMSEELARYDWVIHLDSSAPFDLGCNSTRTESAEESMVLNDKIKRAWQEHAHRIILPTDRDFEGKVELAIKVIKRMLQEKTHEVESAYSRLPTEFLK